MNEDVPTSGTVRLCDSSNFSFVRNLHTALQRSYTTLRFHHQYGSVLVPYPQQLLLSFAYLVIAILTRVRWDHKIVLICIALNG